MLRQIIVVVSDWKRIKEKNKLFRRFKKIEESGICVWKFEFEKLLKALEKEEGMSLDAFAMEETLWITDDERMAQEIYDIKGFGIAYLHENNRAAKLYNLAFAVEALEEVDVDYYIQIYQRYRKIPWHIVSTVRCEVRETCIQDVDAFYQIYSDPSITEYTEGLFPDKVEEEAYLSRYIDEVYPFLGYGMWTVIDRRSKKIIGRAGFSIREGFEKPELGYVFTKEFQGKGYAYEVCSAVLNYGKLELGFDIVHAVVHEGNQDSHKLCKKLGFRATGKLMVEGCPHILYELNL